MEIEALQEFFWQRVCNACDCENEPECPNGDECFALTLAQELHKKLYPHQALSESQTNNILNADACAGPLPDSASSDRPNKQPSPQTTDPIRRATLMEIGKILDTCEPRIVSPKSWKRFVDLLKEGYLSQTPTIFNNPD